MAFTVEEANAKTEELRAAGLPTMSETAERRREMMTPLTIEMNERMHAVDVLMDDAEDCVK